jgi:prepilin-type N-terminal cleavage/methylation domain-containing protein
MQTHSYDTIFMNKKIKIQKRVIGFTLIELLIVVAVIAILAALAFVALNPLARFQDSRNAQRWTDVNAILEAIKLHQVDNGGLYLTAIENLTASTSYQIGTGSNCNDSCPNPTVTLQTACVNLSALVTGGYLASIPIDPNDSDASATEARYYLIKYSTGTITVGSCSEELGSNSSIPNISISR